MASLVAGFALSSIALSGTVPPSAIPATRQLPSGHGPWMVRAYYTNDQSLTNLLERAAPSRVDRKAGVLIVEVANRAEYQRLLDDGFAVAIDPKLTEEAYAEVERLPGQVSSIPGFLCYRTVEESFASMQAVVAAHPQIAEIVDIGDSWKKRQTPSLGYDLNVLRLTNRAIPGPKPVHYMQGALHAREYATAETVLRYGEWLAGQYGTNPDVTWVLDHHEVLILVHANPDGRKIAEVSATRMQRKNRNENFCATGGTSLGVDNNRNFPFDWGGAGSSGTACGETFRGPSAASEFESQAIIDYLRLVFPDQRAENPGVDLTTPISADASGIYMDVHSNAGTTWWPWGNVNGVLAPNAIALQTLGRKLSFYNGLTPEQSNAGGAIGGATDDFAYGTLGVAAFTVEMDGTSFFPTCAIYESDLALPTMDGFFAASKLARAPYRLAAGPELINIAAMPASVAASGSFTVVARADDTRFRNEVGTEPSQVVLSVAIYSTPPWVAGATPLAAMQPTDGSFNTSAENVTVQLAASSFGPGLHLVYLQATDALGNKGAVSAVFVSVTGAELFGNGFE